MLTLMLLYAVPVALVLTFFLLPRERRRGKAKALLACGLAGAVAATMFIIAVNYGWLSP